MTRLFDEYAYFFIPLLAFMVDAILSKTPAKAKLEATLKESFIVGETGMGNNFVMDCL